MTVGRTVVLGGGCAGLAAAWRLGKNGISVVLIETSDHVGGLAGGIRVGGNVYEYGPHIFHTTDEELLAEIKELMGEDLLPYKRTIQIKFLGSYFSFPLSMAEVFFKLSPWTLVRAGGSFLYYFILGALSRPAVENSETVLQRYYGDVLYRIFFKDYIKRVWGFFLQSFLPLLPDRGFHALISWRSWTSSQRNSGDGPRRDCGLRVMWRKPTVISILPARVFP